MILPASKILRRKNRKLIITIKPKINGNTSLYINGLLYLTVPLSHEMLERKRR